MGKRCLLSDKSGAALVIALLIMALLTVIAISSSFTSIFEVETAGKKRAATSAFYTAESGIQSVKANPVYFDVPGKYVDNRFEPFRDPEVSNPSGASVVIQYHPELKGAPRGSGMSALNFEFEYFTIRSKGEERLDSGNASSECTVEEKVVRLLPSEQGGY